MTGPPEPPLLDPTVLPFTLRPKRRSAGWGAVRGHAPVMPWEDESELSDPMMRDLLLRIAAVSGRALVLRFYLDVLDLQDRLSQAEGEGPPLAMEESRPIIRDHYHELAELHGRDYAQRFVRIWLLCSHHVLAYDHRTRVRAVLKRQLARIRTR